MVIGNGMIAKRFGSFTANEDLLIFASGVSNSSNENKEDYQREEALLRNSIAQNQNSQVIYFSTCSIYDSSLIESAYVMHKLKMEEVIKKMAASYIIFRVSNPVGFTLNKNTVLNYFIDHIKSGEAFLVWKNASRNLIDLEDMFNLCRHIIKDPSFNEATVNIANPLNYPVINIIESIEKHLNKKGNYHLVVKGNSPLIDTSDIEPLFSKLHINFKEDYLDHLLQKYFPVS